MCRFPAFYFFSFFSLILAAITAAATAHGQFIKQIDENGHVTYSQEPGYDYSLDEPSAENQRINEAQLKKLRAFIEYRESLPEQPSRAPKMTIRTGRAVCKKRISLMRPGIPDC